MIKNIFFAFFCVMLLHQHFVFAQTYNKTKEVDIKQIDSLAKDIRQPAKAELRYWFTASDMNEPTYKSDAEKMQVIAKYEKLVKKNPENLQDYAKYYNLLFEKNPQDTATYRQSRRVLIEKYSQKLAKEPKNGDYMYELAIMYTALYDYVKAFDFILDAKEAKPNDAKIYATIGWLNNTLNEYEKAKKFGLEAIQRNDTELDYYVTVITAEMFINMTKQMAKKEGEFTAMSFDMAFIEKAKAKYPKREEFVTLHQTTILLEEFYNAMFGLFNTIDENADMQEKVKKMRNLSPKLIALEKYFQNLEKTHKGGKSFILNSLGVVYFLQGNDAKSKEFFQKAITANPNRIQVYGNLIFLDVMFEDYAKAEKTALQKMAKFEEADDYTVLAEIYSNLKQAAKCDSVLQKGFEKYPNHSNIQLFQALNLYKNGQYEQSHEKLTNLLKNDSSNDDAVWLYALLSLRLNKDSEALDALYYAARKGNKTAAKLFDEYFELKE
jgi:tetratricopeptide (TPR) repeat protein